MKIGIVPCFETEGQERIKTKFAFLPIVLSDNTKIIWKKYKIIEKVEEKLEWDDDAFYGFGKSFPSGEFYWVVKKKYI